MFIVRYCKSDCGGFLFVRRNAFTKPIESAFRFRAVEGLTAVILRRADCQNVLCSGGRSNAHSSSRT